MEKDHLSRKLAVILHADVVGSTSLVQKNETIAHRRIQAAFNQFSKTIEVYGGVALEIRGDALVAEFSRASDAVSAALLFQQQNHHSNTSMGDDIRPTLRIGISLGEVVIADGTVTGEGIVLAQRLEQIAEAGGIVVQGTISETVPSRLGFQFDSLGEVQLKGFTRPIRAFVVGLADEATIPEPEAAVGSRNSDKKVSFSATTAWLSGIGLMALVVLLGVLAWQPAKDEYATGLPPLPPGPRFAVMPFEPGDPVSNGLTEDLIESLSKFSTLLVFPKIATKTLHKEGADCESIREALGANFILSGSVRRQESRLRVNVSLVNAIDCSQLWVEKFDRELTTNNLFSTTDEIVSKIASITGSAATGYESIADVIRTNNPQNLDVYDCVLSAQWYYDSLQEQDHKKARDCLEWAVEQEPGYAEAHRLLASLYMDETKDGLEHRYPDSLERAKRHLENAERIMPDSDGVFYKKALLVYLTECDGYDNFYAAANKAIKLNPNNFTLVGDIGNHMGYSGKYERGLALLERAKQLNPRHPKWVYILPMLNSYRIGDYPAAVSYYQKMGPGLANHPMIKTLLAATYARQGEISKAQETINQIIENHPRFEDHPRQPFLARRMEPKLIESVMEGLRAADYDVPPMVKVGRC
jgi:adenylate cyclase